MSYSIITTKRFDKQFKALYKKYPSIPKDLSELAAKIAQNPTCGIHLGNDVYKIRMSITSKGKGKSAGARIIYFNLFAQVDDDNRVVFISIYDKSDMESISNAEISEALQYID